MSKEPIRVVVICAALVHQHAQARWRLLSERFPVDVTLLLPNTWEQSNVWNVRQQWAPKELHDGRFNVMPLPVWRVGKGWLFKSLDTTLRRLQPDLIYVIQGEMAWQLSHTLVFRDLYCSRSKVIFFTMNALGMQLRRFDQRVRWELINRGVEAGLCHYPGCLASLRQLGFRKPVFLQTQVGVDERVFFVDAERRLHCRHELGLDEGSFVVGCVARFTEEKGVLDLLDAFPVDNVDWRLLILGEGTLRAEIKRLVRDRGLESRVHLTGLVPPNAVAHYLRAMDCLVHVPHTTTFWIETFSLAVAQAMACGLPVIGSDSGSVPWQIKDAGIIVKERDPQAIRGVLASLASDRLRRQQLGEAARKQALTRFCVSALTTNFYSIIRQVITGQYMSAGDCEALDYAYWNDADKHKV